MRLRRVVQALLRHRRIDERETSYHDVVWENAMEAYESTPDPEPEISPVVEITPYIQARLDAAKAELLLKAHRTKRQRDIRRRELRRKLVFAGTTLLALCTGIGGVNAMTTGRVGIAPIDDFLGLEKPKPDVAGIDRPSHAPTLDDTAVAPGTSTVSLRVDLDRGQSVTSAAYVSRSGYACFASVKDAAGTDQLPASGGGCTLPSSVADRVKSETAFISGTQVGDIVIVEGYAAANVEEVAVTGPGGRLEVHLGSVWTPEAPGGRPVRPLLGALALDEDASPFPAASGLALDPRNYELRLEMRDGRAITVPSALDAR